jgi:hypothetical protein
MPKRSLRTDLSIFSYFTRFLCIYSSCHIADWCMLPRAKIIDQNRWSRCSFNWIRIVGYHHQSRRFHCKYPDVLLVTELAARPPMNLRAGACVHVWRGGGISSEWCCDSYLPICPQHDIAHAFAVVATLWKDPEKLSYHVLTMPAIGKCLLYLGRRLPDGAIPGPRGMERFSKHRSDLQIRRLREMAEMLHVFQS